MWHTCGTNCPGFMNGKLACRRASSVQRSRSNRWGRFQRTLGIGNDYRNGRAIKILTTGILTQIGQTVLQHTVMTALMGALQWPIMLTKLGHLIDSPWNNALDPPSTLLARLLIQRHLFRPITFIGFSLRARVIFHTLLELAKSKAFGIVQDVFLC
ncbi:hypothetical protein F5J12DRAFT_820722 [Pisolithus orientalis]|uniref:uncharacterized protein n=1 Tax=Pisolithus orientalis TaxID=936130 RepID=UPI002224873B|nr:uncharacterized protein F5J12DRAFT_820722 [Pisolithus orientalis]KAI6012785.1 hypothetical protein F5J12DRAFT_820722 [Pisolithus orientalis]